MSSGANARSPRRKLARAWPLLVLIAFLVGAVFYSEGMKTRAEVGHIAPDFSLSTLDGSTIALADLRGQPVIVNFWATWCPYCHHEAPAHQAFLERYGDELHYVAVNLREPPERIRGYRERFAARGIPLQRMELLDRQAEVYDLYRSTGTPETWVIDAEGRAVRHFVGPSRFEDLVLAVEETGVALWEEPPVGWVYAAASSQVNGTSVIWLGTEQGAYKLVAEGSGLDTAPTFGPRFALPIPLRTVRSLSAAPDRPVVWAVGRWEGFPSGGAERSPHDDSGFGESADRLAQLNPGTSVLVRWEDDPLGEGRWDVLLPNADVLAVAAGPEDRVYAWTRESGLLVSDDGGVSWEERETPYRPDLAGVPLAVDPLQPDHILSAGPGGVWRSRDGGQTWTPTDVDVSVTAIAFHPERPAQVFFTDDEGVQVSSDGARTASRLDGSPQRRLSGIVWMAVGGGQLPLALAPNGDLYGKLDRWLLLAPSLDVSEHIAIK